MQRSASLRQVGQCVCARMCSVAVSTITLVFQIPVQGCLTQYANYHPLQWILWVSEKMVQVGLVIAQKYVDFSKQNCGKSSLMRADVLKSKLNQYFIHSRCFQISTSAPTPHHPAAPHMRTLRHTHTPVSASSCLLSLPSLVWLLQSNSNFSLANCNHNVVVKYSCGCGGRMPGLGSLCQFPNFSKCYFSNLENGNNNSTDLKGLL